MESQPAASTVENAEDPTNNTGATSAAETGTATSVAALGNILPGMPTLAPPAAGDVQAHDDDDAMPPVDPNAPVNWRLVYKQLYMAVSAGPHTPHPLPEYYYGSFAIWYKQHMMLEAGIGDDEAGSRLAALRVAFEMRDAGVRPEGGTVWGTPAQLAYWREHCNDNPHLHEEWSELVLAFDAWQDGYFAEEDAAWRMATLPSDAEAITVPGPWGFSGDRAQQERALELAELLEKAAAGARREMEGR